MGVADSEFTDPNGTGRIHLYPRTGSIVDKDTPDASTLCSTAATMQKYVMVVIGGGAEVGGRNLALWPKPRRIALEVIDQGPVGVVAHARKYFSTILALT